MLLSSPLPRESQAFGSNPPEYALLFYYAGSAVTLLVAWGLSLWGALGPLDKSALDAGAVAPPNCLLHVPPNCLLPAPRDRWHKAPAVPAAAPLVQLGSASSSFHSRTRNSDEYLRPNWCWWCSLSWSSRSEAHISNMKNTTATSGFRDRSYSRWVLRCGPTDNCKTVACLNYCSWRLAARCGPTDSYMRWWAAFDCCKWVAHRGLLDNRKMKCLAQPSSYCSSWGYQSGSWPSVT